MVAEQKKERYSLKKSLETEPSWSVEQSTIFNWVSSGTGNLRVGAVAGSGKSSVLTAIVNRIPKDDRVCLVAFNVHTVASIAAKLPTRVTVVTAHGMGNSLLCRFFEGGTNIEENKYRQIARALVKELDVADLVESAMAEQRMSGKVKALTERQMDESIRAQLRTYLIKLIDGCQATLIEPTLGNLRQLDDYYRLACPNGGDRVLPLVSFALDRGEEMARAEKTISFGDMLWLPYKWQLYPASKDWTLVDECQDANPAQLSLYKKLLSNGRAVLVGDERQAIMGFAFASPEMWGNVGREFNAQDLPLSTCYRCPTSHLDLARYFVPQIVPTDSATDGEIKIVNPSEIKDMVSTGDLILCRFTAPLVELCLELIVSGIIAKVRGRDIGVQLVAMSKQVNAFQWTDFLITLGDLTRPKIKKLRNQDKDTEADSLTDRFMAVKACFESFGVECHSLAAFTQRIMSLFSDDAVDVTLCTIHRAKGDEADRVFILSCNSLPYTPKDALGWQLEQEDNLTYVAVTRAKQSLFLAPLGRDNSETEALCKRPLGGMRVTPTPINVEPIAPSIAQSSRTLEDTADIDFSLPKPQSSRTNNNGTPNGTYPLPQSASILFQSGQMVVFDGNPRNACKILAIDGNTATVQRGTVGATSTVALGQLKSLVPV